MLMSDRSPSVVVGEVSFQAVKNPSRIAAALDSDFLTYHELETRADRLSNRLKSLGASREAVVAVWLKRSPSFVVAALAALKSGAAYLPVDSNYPREALRVLLQEARVQIVMTDRTLAETLDVPGIAIVDVSDIDEASAISPASSEAHISPQDLAYVIYTSGSSGKPKGVEVTHANLMNLIQWHNSEFQITPDDQASQMAGLGFDASVWEIWPYLAAGATIRFLPDALRTDPDGLQKWLVEQKITVSFVPTPLAEYLIRWPWPGNTSLRLLLTGGDALHHYPAAMLPFRVVNNYGPTECTVVATSCELAPADAAADLPPIGRAIANAGVYILDAFLQPVPPGEVGEIYVSGAGVARGYRLSEELTAKRFLPDPFASAQSASAGQAPRMYKTGDIGRFLPDGQIQFLGRADSQIKLRGYRIEPEQVERIIESHPSVQSAVVTLVESKTHEKSLAAYIVPKPGTNLSDSGLRSLLSARLPSYMVPSAFIVLDKLPITENGKIDRRRLPLPMSANILRDPAPARAATDSCDLTNRVAGMLAGLLTIESVSADDNFFMLGGHSLLGAQLIARIRDAFGVDLGLKALFDAPTVALLAAEIEKQLLVPVPVDTTGRVHRISADTTAGPSIIS